MDNFEGYAPWLRVNNCCEGTIVDRLYVLTDFERSHPSFPQVTAGEITNWVGRPGYAQWTRATYFGHLRSYYTWATGLGIVDVDPMSGMRRPKHGRGIPRPLNACQVHAVMTAATNPNMHAWLTLGLYAGLRAHEIAKIRGEDVDQDQMYVFGKGGQGAFLPTHPLIWAIAEVRPRVGWWFPTGSASGHVTSLSVSTMTSRLFTAHGIDGSIHRCRHTFATQLLRAGVNIRVVQTLMRHESLASTQIYTAVDEDERRDAIALLMAA
jgi:site-specific recombinase XerD